MVKRQSSSRHKKVTKKQRLMMETKKEEEEDSNIRPIPVDIFLTAEKEGETSSTSTDELKKKEEEEYSTSTSEPRPRLILKISKNRLTSFQPPPDSNVTVKTFHKLSKQHKNLAKVKEEITEETSTSELKKQSSQVLAVVKKPKGRKVKVEDEKTEIEITNSDTKQQQKKRQQKEPVQPIRKSLRSQLKQLQKSQLPNNRPDQPEANSATTAKTPTASAKNVEKEKKKVGKRSARSLEHKNHIPPLSSSEPAVSPHSKSASTSKSIPNTTPLTLAKTSRAIDPVLKETTKANKNSFLQSSETTPLNFLPSKRVSRPSARLIASLGFDEDLRAVTLPKMAKKGQNFTSLQSAEPSPAKKAKVDWSAANEATIVENVAKPTSPKEGGRIVSKMTSSKVKSPIKIEKIPFTNRKTYVQSCKMDFNQQGIPSNSRINKTVGILNKLQSQTQMAIAKAACHHFAPHLPFDELPIIETDKEGQKNVNHNKNNLNTAIKEEINSDNECQIIKEIPPPFPLPPFQKKVQKLSNFYLQYPYKQFRKEVQVNQMMSNSGNHHQQTRPQVNRHPTEDVDAATEEQLHQQQLRPKRALFFSTHQRQEQTTNEHLELLREEQHEQRNRYLASLQRKGLISGLSWRPPPSNVLFQKPPGRKMVKLHFDPETDSAGFLKPKFPSTAPLPDLVLQTSQAKRMVKVKKLSPPQPSPPSPPPSLSSSQFSIPPQIKLFQKPNQPQSSGEISSVQTPSTVRKPLVQTPSVQQPPVRKPLTTLIQVDPELPSYLQNLAPFGSLANSCNKTITDVLSRHSIMTIKDNFIAWLGGELKMILLCRGMTLDQLIPLYQLPNVVARWTPDHVAQFISMVGFPKTAAMLRRNEVDGVAMLLLRAEDLTGVLGLLPKSAAQLQPFLIRMHQNLFKVLIRSPKEQSFQNKARHPFEECGQPAWEAKNPA